MSVNLLLKRSSTASKRPVAASMAFGELNLNYDASTGGLFYKDTAGAVVKVGPCQVSSTAPNSVPGGSSGNSPGEFWYDTSTSTLKVFNGTVWKESGGAVDGVTGSAPITVNNTDPLNPIVGINSATTTAAGAVQLNDSTSSSSVTEALTANQGRILQTQIDALVVSSNLTFAGTIDAATGNMVTVSTEGGLAGFTIGNVLPSPGVSNTEFFVIVTIPGTMTPPGGSAQMCHQGDWWLSDGTAWNFLDIGYNAPYATTLVPGIVQLATDAEVQAGVNTDHAVVPSSLQSKLSDSVSTTSSTVIASATAAKTAYNAGIQGQTDAAAAQATADAALPRAGGTMTGNVTFSDAGERVVFSDSSSVYAIGDSVSTTSSTTAASSTAVKSAYDLAGSAQSAASAAQVDATQALSDAAAAQVDATQAIADAAAAQATASAAMPLSGGTFTNNVTFSAGPGLGIIVALGAITPGSGYTPGVYSGVELTGGTGVAAIVDITVGPSGEVTNVDLIDGGIDYTVGDVLTYALPGGAGWSIPVIQTSPPVGAAFTIDNPSTLANNGSLVQNGESSFNGQVNLSDGVYFSDTTQTYFDPGSTVGFNGDVEVNGSFVFNVAPTFPAGVSLGAASQVTYDNVTSGLAATDVQGAIDEIVAEYVPNASFASAGDLLVGSGAGTYAALPAGAADYILSSDGLGALVWVPQSQGDVTGVTGTAPITVDNTDPQNPVVGIDAASTTGAGAVQLSDSTSSTSTTEAATANAVKTAYDAAVAAQATADAALPKAGGSMSGNITFSDAGEGLVFSDSSSITGLSNSTSSPSTTVAASSAAVKAAYDAAIAAQNNGPLTSDTVLYVNSTDGNDSTAARGSDKPFATITAALAAATDGDTIFLSPGTFTENVTISKGVHLAGTFCDQATWSGTKILGNTVVNLAGGVTRNLAISDIYFISATATSPFSVTGMSPGAGGINTVTGCMFTQASVTDTAQFAVQTSGTWTRSLYMRECTIDGNFKHNAGTAAGASGYIVVDQLLGVGNSSMYHSVLTGTVEYRNPSNSLAAILQTGGIVLVNGASSGITANSATTTAIFGGTGFSYKGTAASVGTGTIYFSGGSNQGSGKVDIGANVIYGWTNLTIDPANLTVNVAAVAYTTAVPAAATTVSATQQRPRLDLLKTTSSVAAASQLGTVIDSTTGALYSVSSFDAGVY